ncbi:MULTISPECIES: hypothetical protein [Rhodococcus]|jgi:hypothetical protein|uniref:hypothetical protein n=1 Tax=Rhodococcus TaxID=1827 RepID=UPI0005DF0C13|nr:hypothetical protein SZ00_03157 [Rhodococcus sp. AD45]
MKSSTGSGLSLSRDVEPVSLDLVPIALIAPRLKRIAVAVIVLGVVVGLVVSVFASTTVALLVGFIIAVPTSLAILMTLRRHITLYGKKIRAQAGFRTGEVDAAEVVTAELMVRTGRISEVSMKLTDARSSVRIPLALYTAGGGRELEILALRKLADALASSELVPAAALSSVLIEQLRAEARGAGLAERPLYRAVELVSATGRVPRTTLTDHEVAGLLD